MTDTVLTDDPELRTDDRDDDAPASVRVVDAVADVTDRDPLAMAPLYEVVDPDALDQLFASEVDGHVAFEYAGFEVEVHGDGTLLVDGSVAEVA